MNQFKKHHCKLKLVTAFAVMFLFVVAKVAFPFPVPGQSFEFILGADTLYELPTVNVASESPTFFLQADLESVTLPDFCSVNRTSNVFLTAFGMCAHPSPLISPRGPPVLA